MTFRRIPVIIRGLLLSGLVLAAGAAVADDIRYRVVAGDTLIGLGERFLARPSAWPRLQQLNGVADPYSIPVGTVLRIPRGMLRPEPRAMRVEAVSGAALADGRALAAGDEVKAPGSAPAPTATYPCACPTVPRWNCPRARACRSSACTAIRAWPARTSACVWKRAGWNPIPSRSADPRRATASRRPPR